MVVLGAMLVPTNPRHLKSCTMESWSLYDNSKVENALDSLSCGSHVIAWKGSSIMEIS